MQQQPTQEEPQPVQQQPTQDQQQYQEPMCWKNGVQFPCNNPPQELYQKYKQTVCGDGVCEGDEKYGCQDDCGFTAENPQTPEYINSGEYKKQLYGSNWCANGQCCPDGVCDDFERSSKGCPSDCGWNQPNVQTPQVAQGPQQQQNYMSGACMDGNTLKIAQEKCSSAGGQVEIEDVNGCQKLNCKITGSYGGGIGQMGMDQNGMGDARQKCESMGLTADVIQGLDGYRIECVEKGYQQVGYVDKEIDATEALEFVFKLEEIKMKLDEDGELYNRVDNLYKYCKEKGEEDCSNYENAMAKMSEAREAIGSLREQMKTSIEQNGKLTVDNLYMFKSMTRSIIEQNLMTIAYALLGVDMSAMETEPIEIGDCGSEAACFEEKFRSCAVGSSVSPGEGVTLTIKNLDENGNCQIDIETDAGTATCNFKEAEYKYMPLSKEAFNFETCGEELEAILPKETQKYNPGEIGGKETYCKVTETCDCDEVCEENDGEDQYCDDCMRFGMCGDGLCEPKVGEDSSNCPADCIGPSEEVVLEPVEEETPTEEVPVEETPTEEVPAEEVA